MEQPTSAKDLSDFQDVLGQLVHGVYTPLCMFFTLDDQALVKDHIIRVLSEGLERVSGSFPYLAGQVTTDDSTSHGNKPGRPIITPLDQNIRLIVRDYTQDETVPSMDTLRKARFPSDMIDGKTFTSLSGAPSTFGDSNDEPQPVFFVQANFLRRGFALTLAGEHSVIDGQGMGQLMKLLSKACHNEPFTEEELQQGNRARGNIIPLLDIDTYKPGAELDYLISKPKPDDISSSSPPTVQDLPNCRWSYFHISSSNQSKLKALASIPDPTFKDPPLVPYITTNDAISAFIWQSVSRVRSLRLPSPTVTTSTFGRAVDVRPALSVPTTYPGNLSHHTYTTLPLSTIISSTLFSLASLLRHALSSPDTIAYAIRSLATHYSRLFLLHTQSQRSSPPSSSTGNVSYGANMNFSHDIFFSSWTKLPCYSLDFNLGLGFAECVRRPKFLAIEGLMYLMPADHKRSGGGIDAAICLREEDMQGLIEDEEFRGFAEVIG